MKVSIVIPNWNGAEKLKEHLPEVLSVARANEIDEVIVADDASTDDSIEVIKNNFPQVKLLEKKKNTGFGSNVNFGVSKAAGDLIVLLNTDAVPDKDFLKFALPHFEDPKVFSVGLNAGGYWSWAKFEKGFFWHYQADRPENQPVNSHQTLWASGGSSVFRRSIWEELGGFDPLYDPFYVEDVDLGYRATKRGYINIWEPKAKVEHYKERGVIESNFSKSRVTRTAERNQLIFTWKNITDRKLMRQHQLALLKRLIRHPKFWEIFLRAAVKLPKIIKQRNTEKKYAKLTDGEILTHFSAR